jgi:hypothetical protein
MKRVLIPLVIAAGLLGPPAHSATTEESIVAELREQGFQRIEIRRTLLGRTRILAESSAYEREIILNPATGVILRDYWKTRGAVGRDGPSSLVGGPNLRDGGNAASSGGSGSSGSGRDDDDDDNSSSGSGSGGSGSSGSGSGSDDNDDDDSDSGSDDSSSGSDDDDSDSGSGSDDSDSGSDDSDDDDDDG